jgi:hypothetical protein
VAVLLGNGDGTFQPPLSYDSGGGCDATSIAIADLNGDGKLDIAVTTANPNGIGCGTAVSVLLGNGDATFQAPVSYSPGGSDVRSVAIRDVNGDGKPDLVVSNGCQSISGQNCIGNGVVGVLQGYGDGTFQPPVRYSSGGQWGRVVAVEDVNGDSRPDIIVANFASATVGVLLNNLAASTNTALTSSPNPSVIKQSVRFTATISSNPPIPDGEIVSFYNGATKIGTGTTKNGIANLTRRFSKSGTFTIRAKYAGDTFHRASSGAVKQVVNP